MEKVWLVECEGTGPSWNGAHMREISRVQAGDAIIIMYRGELGTYIVVLRNAW